MSAGTTFAARAPVLVAPLWGGLVLLALIPALSFVAPTKLLNLAFLAAAAGLGAIWMDKAPRNYLLLVVFLFVFTPLVRRIIDFNTSYSAANPAMLAPYLTLCIAAPYALMAAFGGRRYSAELLMMMAAVAWGAAIGFHYSNPVEVVLSALRWVAPLLLLGYLLCKGTPDLLDSMVPVLLLLGVIASIYGIVQYVLPLPWDVYWIENTPIGSGPLGILGNPEPFSLRVFGSSNSPGSFATALVFGVALALTMRSVRMLPVMLVVFLAVPLTLQRSVMGALIITVFLIFLFGPPLRRRILALLTGCVLVLVLGLGLFADRDPTGFDRIGERFSMSGKLSEDTSFVARKRQAENFGDWVQPYLVGGYGFDWKNRIETTGGQNIQNPVFVMDNGVFDTILTLGAVAGAVYLVALCSLALGALSEGARTGWTSLGAACVGIGLLAQLPLGTVQAGELGIFAFLGLGLALKGAPSGKAGSAGG